MHRFSATETSSLGQKRSVMRKITFIFFVLSISYQTIGYAEADDARKLAQQAFDAWHKGENSGDYSDFKVLLSDSFRTFEHPFAGRFKNVEARDQINGMIAQREGFPNHLSFSDVSVTAINSTASDYYFHFRSTGEVMGKFQYDGYNIIIITVKNGKVIGFREYLGLIDPNWFK